MRGGGLQRLIADGMATHTHAHARTHTQGILAKNRAPQSKQPKSNQKKGGKSMRYAKTK